MTKEGRKTTMKYRTHLWLAGSLLLGCSGAADVERQTSGEEPGAFETTPEGNPLVLEQRGRVEGAAAARSVRLATVELSPTHRVEFLHYPDQGVMAVKESMHADVDDVSASLSTRGVPEDATFDEIYVEVAGAGVDWAVVEELREVEASLAEGPVLAGADEAPALADGVDRADETQPEVTRPENAGGENVARTAQAACAEPAWDWVVDDQWFRSHFCDPSFQYCDTFDPSHSDNRQNRYSRSWFFNQSHCSNATYELRHRYATACWLFGCTRRTFTLEYGTLLPRRYIGWLYSAGRDASDQWHRWYTSIVSAQGNFTAMSHHGYNQ
jgi:hypothetical protein